MAAGSDRARWWALTAVSVATLMSYLDNNVINVALPTIQRSLNLSVTGLEWIVSSYLLVFAGLLLVGGRIADVYGRRRVFLIGLTVFTLASLASGLAGSGGVLIGTRAVQGLGAALMVPATLAIITAAFTDARERTAAIGIWTAVTAVGLALGPFVGGVISQHAHWGWIFLINVPLGAIALVIAWPSVRESRAESTSRGLDIPGLVSSAVALFALTYALIDGSDRGWTSPLITAAFAVAAAAFAVFLAVESRSQAPMVPLGMFRSREFSGGTTTMMIWGFSTFGIYFFTSLFIQGILGFSPTKAGLAFVPMALCLALLAGIAPRVVTVIGAHRTVALGMAVMVGGLVLFARTGAGSSFGSLMPGLLLFGAGAGLMNVPLTNSVLQAAPSSQAGVASALLNDSRELSGLLGITVLGAVLRTRQGDALHAGTAPPQAFLDGYHTSLWVTIALMAAGTALSYLALRPRPAAPESAPGIAPLGADPAEDPTARL
ncbi:MAG: MFS transporter [Nocardiopsaceae bacterium]|nr:MFS transporter [Nocardiopsaceae bacterium]